MLDESTPEPLSLTSNASTPLFLSRTSCIVARDAFGEPY